MNLDKIKNLVKHNGDKFVFLENGEPEMVVMSFGEYQRLAASNANDANRYANPVNDVINEYSSHSSERFASLESLPQEEVGLPVRLEDIRLEDLPI